MKIKMIISFSILLLVITGCSISSILPPKKVRDDTINIYAVAVPYLNEDINIEIDNGSSVDFYFETLFVPIQIEYIENTIYTERDFIDTPLDKTAIRVIFPDGLCAVDEGDNILKFIRSNNEMIECDIYSSEKIEDDYFMKKYGDLMVNGKNETVYRFADESELEEILIPRKMTGPICLYPVAYSVTTLPYMSNSITTNEYTFHLRNSVSALTNFTNVTVNQEIYDLFEALGDKYYPLSGKGHLTINNWP